MQHPELLEMQRQFTGALGGARTVVTEGLLMLTGVYTTISPWVIGFAGTHPALTADNVILGLILTAIGMGLTGTPERRGGISWTAVPIGAWLIISAWVLHGPMLSFGALVNNIVVGALAIVLGLVVAGLVTMTRPRTPEPRRGDAGERGGARERGGSRESGESRERGESERGEYGDRGESRERGEPRTYGEPRTRGEP